MQGRISRLIMVMAVYLSATSAYAASEQPYGLYSVHVIVFYTCCVISITVFLVLLGSLVKFRLSNTEKVHFHKHLASEMLWATIPFIILILLALPAAIGLQQGYDKQESKIKLLGDDNG